MTLLAGEVDAANFEDAAGELSLTRQLERLGRILRRSWAVILVSTAVITAAALFLSSRQVALYEATTTVLLNRQDVASQLSGAQTPSSTQPAFQQLLVTQAKIARSPEVLRSALTRYGTSGVHLTVAKLRASSSVAVDQNTDLLQFMVRRPSRNEAMLVSAGYARAYLAYRLSLDTHALRAAIADVSRARSEALRRGSLGQRLANSLGSRLESLQTRAALQTDNAQIVALPDTAPRVRPNTARNAAAGVVLGIALGFLLAFLRDVVDTKVRRPEDAEELLARPALAHVDLTKVSPALRRGVVILEEPSNPAAESYRMLSANMKFATAVNGARTIMVTSGHSEEGKTTTLANLAAAIAMTGQRVVVVDADLRRPKIATQFGVGQGPGLTNVVLDDIDLPEALIPVALPPATANRQPGALSVLTSGPCPPNPAEFLTSPAVDSIVARLRESFDIVLIDAPPYLGLSDGVTMSRLVDGVLICVRVGRAERPALIEVRKTLERTRLPILGLAITGRLRSRRAGYYGYE